MHVALKKHGTSRRIYFFNKFIQNMFSIFSVICYIWDEYTQNNETNQTKLDNNALRLRSPAERPNQSILSLAQIIITVK